VDRPLTLTAADGYDPTIRIQGDTNSDRSVGIRVAASYVTISDIEVDAGGAVSGIHVLNSVGADIDDVTVSNVRDAILAELTISLLVRSCDLAGTEHGIRISWLGWNSQLADNEIRRWGWNRHEHADGRWGRTVRRFHDRDCHGRDRQHPNGGRRQ
jgi:hypothetical protein